MTGADIHPDALELIEILGLTDHPEGGFYRETFRSPLTLRGLPWLAAEAERSASTAIYFLLPRVGSPRFIASWPTRCGTTTRAIRSSFTRWTATTGTAPSDSAAISRLGSDLSTWSPRASTRLRLRWVSATRCAAARWLPGSTSPTSRCLRARALAGARGAPRFDRATSPDELITASMLS